MDVPHAINTNKGQEMIPFNILNSDSSSYIKMHMTKWTIFL